MLNSMLLCVYREAPPVVFLPLFHVKEKKKKNKKKLGARAQAQDPLLYSRAQSGVYREHGTGERTRSIVIYNVVVTTWKSPQSACDSSLERAAAAAAVRLHNSRNSFLSIRLFADLLYKKKTCVFLLFPNVFLSLAAAAVSLGLLYFLLYFSFWVVVHNCCAVPV